jgi:hypothetical protein
LHQSFCWVFVRDVVRCAIFRHMNRLLAIALLLVAGCRTQPFSGDGGDVVSGDLAGADLRDAGGGDLRRGDLASACVEVDEDRGMSPLQCAGKDCFNSTCCVNANEQLCQSGCGSSFTAFSCDDPQDCTGGICCLQPNSSPRRATCTGVCNGGGIAICKRTSDCPANSGTICQKMPGLPTETGACLPPCL